jgi:hypothetical protein
MKQPEFLSLTGPITVVRVTSNGAMVGWELVRDGNSLHCARGGVRVFKALGGVSSLLHSVGIDDFEVKGFYPVNS